MLMVLLAVVGSMQLAIVSLDTSIGDEDAAAYALLGKSVKDGHGFSSRVVWLFFTRYDQPEHPEDYWPLLQPLLIAASTSLFGDTLLAVKLINILAFLTLACSVFVIGAKLVSRRCGLLAAAMCLASPDLALYALGSRNDLVFVLLATLCCYRMSATVGLSGSQFLRRDALQAGLLAAAAFWQRPVGLLLVPSYGVILAAHVLVDRARGASGVLAGRVKAFTLVAIVFLAAASPYLVWNYSKHGSLLPPLGCYLSALYLNADAQSVPRSIDTDLSHYPEMRKVYFDTQPTVPYDSIDGWKAVVCKGLREMSITLQMIKQSHIISIVLLFFAGLSYFTLPARGRACLEVSAVFFIVVFLLVAFHQHTEQRYFVFMIPMVCIFSTQMMRWIEIRLLIDSGAHGASRVNSGRLRGYRLFIAAFLVCSIGLPGVSLYRKVIAAAAVPSEDRLAADWLEQNTPADAVIMTAHPYRISFYSGRPTVMLPLASTAELLDVCRHYRVTHVMASDEEQAVAGQAGLSYLEDNGFYRRARVYTLSVWEHEQMRTATLSTRSGG